MANGRTDRRGPRRPRRARCGPTLRVAVNSRQNDVVRMVEAGTALPIDATDSSSIEPGAPVRHHDIVQKSVML